MVQAFSIQKGRIRIVSAFIAVVFMLGLLLTCLPRASAESAPRQVIRVGFFEFEGYHMMGEDGTRSGYGYDFLRMMARYLNVEYEYLGYDCGWDEIQHMLADGEIDLLTSAQKTPEREKLFNFSEPIGTSSCVLSVRSDNTAIIAQDYATYDGMRVGVLRNSSRNDDFEQLAKEKGFSYTVTYYLSADEMAQALQQGKVDAVVSSSLRRTKGERILEEFDTRDFYAMVRKGNTELLDEINYAIDQMNAAEGDWKNALQNKYYTHLENRNLSFTEQEQKLIRQYASGEKVLTIACSTDRAPYSYVENGELKGILSDYFQMVADYVGVPYQVKIPSSRAEFREWQQTNGADVFIDSRLPSEDWLETHECAGTVSYVTMKLAMVTRRDFDGTIRKISIAENQGTYGIEDNLAPGAERVTVPTREDALQAVLNGKVDATFVYLYTAQEFVNRDERGLLTYTALSEPTYEYRMVVSANVDHAMAGILTKAIYALPSGAIDELAAQYTSYKAKNINLFVLIRLYPGFFAGIAILTIGVLIFVVVLLTRLRTRRRLFDFEQKKAEEMSQLAKQAQEANESKSRFLFNMSHDIRTPMNAIIGFTDLALKEPNLPAQVQDDLEKIHISSNHLLAIINDVLEMSRIENSKIELSEEPCDLPALVEEVETIIRVTAEEKKQTFTVDVAGIKNPQVLCDPLRVKEILVNLLSNAVKFTPENGTLSLTIRQCASEEQGVGIYEIRTKDNGIGMSREFLDKVFMPFERERSSTVSGIPGTGLGLSITKRFVELMGGTIRVESAENQGTEFIVELPLKFAAEKDRAVAPQQISEVEPVDFTGKRLLLVEDNELNREIEATVLTGAGFVVDEAEDGSVAVEKVRNAAAGLYDVVLMDIQMPVMDGYAATKEIRSLENKKLAAIPIIAVSANAYDEDVKASLAAGMNGHIAKPIDVKKLMMALSRVLKSKK